MSELDHNGQPIERPDYYSSESGNVNRYYDFITRLPIYDTNILNITNAKHEDADFYLHENL